MKRFSILITLLLALSLLFGCADSAETTESFVQPTDQPTQEIVDEEVHDDFEMMNLFEENSDD